MNVSDLPTKESNVLKGHEGAVLAARFNADGNYCLSCGKDRTIRLWNPHRGIHIKTYKSHGREVRDVHVTPDNSKLCSCGGDRQIFYWDVSTGRVIRKFCGHDSEVNAVKFNDYSSVVVSAGYDRSLRSWDCRSHSTEPIQIIDTFLDSVMSVCLTKTEIIAGSVDGTVRTFDIRIGREISDDLGQPVNCISLSNDGNCILASCLDSTLRLLDRSTGEQLQEYKGHTCKSYKLDCCLTNTDAHVTGGSEDGFIYFWDLADASVVSRFRAHSSVNDYWIVSLSKFPTFLRNQNKLIWLDLSSNNIHGEIPKWIWNISTGRLESLNISHNSLTTLEDHSNLLSGTTLHTLDISFNLLQGSLPLPPLSTNVYLASNNLWNAHLPHFFCNLSNLIVLDVSNNKLSGMLPWCLSSSLSNSLLILNLKHNFHGTIPESWVFGRALRMINLSQNQFHGKVPTSLCNCTTLVFIDFGHNQIQDIFPSWLGDLPELQVLLMPY